MTQPKPRPCTDATCPFFGVPVDQDVTIDGLGLVQASDGCRTWHQSQAMAETMAQARAAAEAAPAPTLAQDILAADAKRVTLRAEQEGAHAERRYRVVTALRGAVAPDADPGPVNALATTLGVEPAALGEVLREMVTRDGRV